MNAANFIFNQVMSLSDDDKLEFAMLWEESKKKLKKPIKKIERKPVHTYEECYKNVIKILENRRRNVQNRKKNKTNAK